MACPFDDDPVDVEAQMIRGLLHHERVIRPRIDVFSYPNEYLHECYRFSKDVNLFKESFETLHIKRDEPRVSAYHRTHSVHCSSFFCDREFSIQCGRCRACGKGNCV